MKITLFASLLVLASWPSNILAQTAAAGPTVTPKAQQIHNSAIVVDTHADTPQRFLDGGFDIGSTDPADNGHVSLDKARAGNLGAEFFSIWVDPRISQNHYAQNTLDLIDSVYQQAARHPDRMMMAFSVDDIERAHKEHKLAALMGIEGGHSIENDIHLLRDFYRLGVRYMTLSWSNTNEWADSSGDINDTKVQHHNGLTEFGKDVVLEMNRLGMMVDISHVADKTFWDAIATTKAPVIASHSSARALANHPRNMTDDMLARSGQEWRRGAGELLLRLRRPEVSGSIERAGQRPRRRSGDAALEKSALRESLSPILMKTTSSGNGWRRFRDRPSARSSTRSITSPKSPESITSAWVRTSTASAARPRRGWTQPPTCRRSRRPCWTEATPQTTSERYWAATCCACFGKSSA